MENENLQEKVSKLLDYDFLIDEEAQELFAEVDYALRLGKHIQFNHNKQTSLFNFIYRNQKNLKNYYRDFYKVKLCQSGESKFNTYFYLGFDQGDRGMIRKGTYEYLDKKHIIIGLVFWEIYHLDLNGTEEISKFAEILLNHDVYKESFFRLFAFINGETEDMYEDSELIVKELRKAFDKFEDLGWIVFENSEKERFTVMPSFRRLTEEMYQNEIENFDKLYKEAFENE